MNGPAALSAAADAVETERESGRRSSNGNAGVRQQKEKLVHSARNKTPACTTPRSEDFRTKPPEPLPRPRKPRPLVFLFWTVHGPFVSGLRAAASRRLASDTRLRAQSRFLLEEKEKMGGAMDQPSPVSNPPRPSGRAPARHPLMTNPRFRASSPALMR